MEVITIDRAEYDPNWELRHSIALKRFYALLSSGPEREVRAALVASQKAVEAQFPTVAAYAEFLFGSVKKSAFRAGFMLAMAPLSAEADDDDVRNEHRLARAQLEAAVRQSKRRPLGQPDGLVAFSATPPKGVIREFRRHEQLQVHGRRQTWGVVFEFIGRTAHVCIVQLERGQGVDIAISGGLAADVYHKFLGGPWWRFGQRWSPHRAHFYSYAPWGVHDTGSERFKRQMTWSRGSFRQNWDRRRTFECVPPFLASFDPKPAGQHVLIPLAEQSA